MEYSWSTILYFRCIAKWFNFTYIVFFFTFCSHVGLQNIGESPVLYSRSLLIILYLAAAAVCISEKAMATRSSTLAWKIPWTEGPGGLQSMGSLGVRHNWATSLYFFTFMHWRRKWQPSPVFLPGESQGRRSLVGCHLWGRTESDTTEVT